MFNLLCQDVIPSPCNISILREASFFVRHAGLVVIARPVPIGLIVSAFCIQLLHKCVLQRADQNCQTLQLGSCWSVTILGLLLQRIYVEFEKFQILLQIGFQLQCMCL